MAERVAIQAELQALEAALDAAERDAYAVVTGLTEAQGQWRAQAGQWSIAECLEHLATANTVYLEAMKEPAARARANGRLRRGPAKPGLLGGWFVRSLEPPVNPRFKTKAPRKIQPHSSPGLQDAFRNFLASQEAVRAFLRANADLDLAGVRFPNPLVRGVRFSLATGLHVIPAHERRHLWQARRIREQVLGTGLE
ncbi:MAG: DinB family protein [Candidatus Korobacteraceae bacterium]